MINALPVFLAIACLASPTFAEQTIVFHADFTAPDALKAWTGVGGQIVEETNRGTPCLMMENDKADGSAMRRARIPADRIAGQIVTISAMVKADNVSEPPKHWNGIKLMLAIKTEHGDSNPQVELPGGTFDWTPVSRSFRISPDATEAALAIGLEKVSGKAWFDDIEVRVGRPVEGGRRYETKFTGHDDVPRLRGVMYGPRLREEDLRTLADWGANLIRWQLNWAPMDPAKQWAKDLARYDEWLDGALAETDKALDLCEKLGIRAVVDLHTAPGGQEAEHNGHRMFKEKRYADKFLEVWDRIAKRYNGRPIILGYDLVNEPIEPKVGASVSWRDLATQAAQVIRAVDPDKPVIYEPGPGGSYDNFDTLKPLDLDRVIYSFHMYHPQEFTHQGVKGQPMGVMYPGVIGKEMWDKGQLRRAMAPAIEFQKLYNVQIFVGEFSAVRWAPDDSAYNYLRDCIDLFEEYGWDWTYHSFREWNGWSVEHGPDPKDPNPSPTQTTREKLLREWFEKNKQS
ncbi:MAG: cellulase family glycosylhydrolase [Candidatus Sumerlaeota bacterium]|nr:cellulase family glycosylhydrolase [Candidatus Sumerlaeota bacterium]